MTTFVWVSEFNAAIKQSSWEIGTELELVNKKAASNAFCNSDEI